MGSESRQTKQVSSFQVAWHGVRATLGNALSSQRLYPFTQLWWLSRQEASRLLAAVPKPPASQHARRSRATVNGHPRGRRWTAEVSTMRCRDDMDIPPITSQLEDDFYSRHLLRPGHLLSTAPHRLLTSPSHKFLSRPSSHRCECPTLSEPMSRLLPTSRSRCWQQSPGIANQRPRCRYACTQPSRYRITCFHLAEDKLPHEGDIFGGLLNPTCGYISRATRLKYGNQRLESA